MLPISPGNDPGFPAGVGRWLVALCLLMGAPVLTAAERPSVALVLSGGGALGYAHIGVLKVLEDMRVPVDCVVGASMGALVGGAYAAGVGPERMIESVTKTDILALFDDEPPRAQVAQRVKGDDDRPLFDFTLGFNGGTVSLPAGASAGYKFELYLKKLVGRGASVTNLDLNRLPTPFRAVATDLETGDLTVFDRGDLPKIMRASMSIPAIVAPTEIDGRIYVDGGLVRNLPVDVGRDLCGDVVIAVNLGTRPDSRERLRSSLDVARQSILILTEQNVRASLAELSAEDVLITPDLDGFTSSNFSSQQEIIRRGIAAGDAARPALKKHAVSAAEYRAWQEQRDRRRPVAPTVTRVAAKPTGPISEDTILRDMRDATSQAFDEDRYDESLAVLYGRGDFSYVGYSIVPEGEGATVLVEATQKPWGPGYLKFGLGVATDFSSPTHFNVAGSYRRTWENRLGAEWRTDAQVGYDSLLSTTFLQPLQVRDGAIAAFYAGVKRSPVQIYQDDVRLGEFNATEASAGMKLGVSGKQGELLLGPFVSNIRSSAGLGVATPVIPVEKTSQFGLTLSGVYDQLDNLAIPRSGVRAAADVKVVADDWGSDEEYVVANVSLDAARSSGNSTFFGQLGWGDEISGNARNVGVHDLFQLGGPRRLSGLYLDQLTGTRYNLASLSYYYQYAALPSQLGRGLYWGASIEAGRINDPLMQDPWEWVTAGSVFWGADTLLGPTYFGYGHSSLGQGSLYLTIGPRF